jgi:hypothetical protein
MKTIEVWLDPRKPGDYWYGPYHFLHKPFYVSKHSIPELSCECCRNRKVQQIRRAKLEPIIINVQEIPQ